MIFFATNAKFIFLISIFFLLNAQKKTSHLDDLTQLVNPFIGTGLHGHTYPGVSLPFGMVQLSPDTRIEGWDACSGYHYSDSLILGFSHTHLSGTGAIDFGDILLMPTVGPFERDAYNGKSKYKGYSSPFSHKNEKASAGYYSVKLDDGNIKVELTATERVGVHRYTFANNKLQNNVLLNLGHGLGPDEVLDAQLIEDDNKMELSGYRQSKGWAKNQTVYFVIVFSEAYDNSDMTFDGVSHGFKNKLFGKDIRLAYNFKKLKKNSLTVKVALSSVSIEGARANLKVETENKTFETILSEAKIKWNSELNKIKIKGGSKNQRQIFYTALYHSLLNPNIASDVNGAYLGMDLNEYTDINYTNYSVFSLWDTFRSSHPLFNLIAPEKNQEFINSLLRKYKENSLLPIWELASNETNTMIGYHSIPIIVDAYLKGFRNFDSELAFEAMKHSAMQDNNGLKYFKKMGLIPGDKDHESVSKSLEYAYDDYCIAIMAKAMGKEEDYKYFITRAKNYINHFDKKSGFMRAIKNGDFANPFNPYEVSGDYTEANAWQYNFFVPHDLAGLKTAFGSDERFEKAVDSLFNASKEITGRGQPDIDGLIGQYAHGNEPSHNFAYLYHYIGKPEKSAKIVRKIMNDFYQNLPEGLIGNEDCGQMSSWFVWNAIGLYPFMPGSNEYLIGSPLFDEVSVKLPNNKLLNIKIKNNSTKNLYVKSVQLNGKKLNTSFINFTELKVGAILILDMTSNVNEAMKIEKQNLPFSKVSEELVATPLIKNAGHAFNDSTLIEIYSQTEGAQIYFSFGQEEISEKSIHYTKPFYLKEAATVQTRAFLKGAIPSFTNQSSFIKLPDHRSISYVLPYSHLYTAGGDNALIDLLDGGESFKNGWQGFHQNNLEVIVDLKEVKQINSISIGCLQNIRSWIFLPKKIELYTSDDNINFSLMNTETFLVPSEFLEDKRMDYNYTIDKKSRFIKVIVENINTCPIWHAGAKDKAWLFVDEIKINALKIVKKD